MATEDTAGGARKATKSKLFEFLVHGVVSGAVRHFSEQGSKALACVCVFVYAAGKQAAVLVVCLCVGER